MSRASYMTMHLVTDRMIARINSFVLIKGTFIDFGIVYA